MPTSNYIEESLYTIINILIPASTDFQTLTSVRQEKRTVKPTNPATTLKGLSTAQVKQTILGTARMVQVKKLFFKLLLKILDRIDKRRLK